MSKHPEISNPYHPTTTLLLSTDQKEGVHKIVNQEETWGKLLKEKEKCLVVILIWKILKVSVK